MTQHHHAGGVHQARARIAAAGVRNTDTPRCLLCGCDCFEAGGPLGTRKPPTGRHDFITHDVPF